VLIFLLWTWIVAKCITIIASILVTGKTVSAKYTPGVVLIKVIFNALGLAILIAAVMSL
jgi:hypothetical protein